MTNQEPDVSTLLAVPQDESHRALAARYAPIICFDVREPFLPLAVGYTIFWKNDDSPSFPRRIELAPAGEPEAAFAIEYAIWWDWDITHLYELEHVWVFVGKDGRVVRGEASWHGRYHSMAVDGKLPLEGERMVVLSQPGKHAFAPSRDWFTVPDRQQVTRKLATRWAGVGGVWVTPLFEGKITSRTPYANSLVHTYLERRAFEPTWDFSRRFVIAEKLLVPWTKLQSWIPDRVAWWVSELARTISPQELRFLRIAHRGASAHAPENTLAAFRLAAELGADMVELDVHVSADGVPVVIHDSSLARTTDGTGLVGDLTLAELKRLDAGRGEHIPTLEEAMEVCREVGMGLYVEVKDEQAVFPLVELLRHYPVEHVLVGSFRPDWVASVKALVPHISTSVLFRALNVDPVRLAQAVGADYVHPCWEWYAPEPHRLLSQEWIKRVREADLGIIIWHEERPEEIAALRQLGVDGICSNQPELLLPDHNKGAG